MTDKQQIQRKDHKLRDSINRLRKQFLWHNDARQVLKNIMQELGKLTNSPIALVLERNTFVNQQPHLICKAAELYRDDQWHGLDLTGKINLDQYSRPLFDSLISTRAAVLDKATLQQLNHLNPSWPKIHRAMTIPLGVKHNTQYLICIVNSEEPYHVDIVKRLWPLLISVSAQLQTIKKQQNILHTEETEKTNGLPTKDSAHWQEAFYQLEHVAPFAMITLNHDHIISRVNVACESLLGKHANELINTPIKNILVNPSHIFQSLQNPSRNNIIAQIYCGNGRLLDTRINSLQYKDAQQHYTLLILNPIANDSDLNNLAKNAMERFQTLAAILPMGILQTDAQWHTEYVNLRWQEMTDSTPESIHGLNWMQIFHPEEAKSLLTNLHNAIQNGKDFNQECRIQNGTDHTWVLLHATPTINDQGSINGLIATITDFTAQHEAESNLRELAEKDVLTGLANRACFFSRLKHALERVERHGSLALLALDLDGFKHINDTLGHDVGDFILIEVANRLRNCMRSEDTICRVGGDEFLLIIEGLEDALIVSSLSEKILESLSNPFYIGKKEIFISTSIGISFSVLGRNANSKSLLKQADLALYRAKDAGRNNYQYYSPELEQVSRRKLELSNRLHRALERQEFEILYQGQVDIAQNTISGVEALLRWRHPEQGLLPPSEFISLLEESVLISNVSHWLYQKSFKQLRQWIDQGHVSDNTVMAVNISPRQFHDKDMVDQLHQAIMIANIHCCNVVVEITETLLMQENDLTFQHLNHLHKLGIKIALDDFGTGYSSLRYLKKYPIDIIKIDRGFIKDLLQDDSDVAITKAVIALGKSLGLSTLAEGVDQAEILTLLKEWKCDKYQGYHLNQPLPAKKMINIFKQFSISNKAISHHKTPSSSLSIPDI